MIRVITLSLVILVPAFTVFAETADPKENAWTIRSLRVNRSLCNRSSLK